MDEVPPGQHAIFRFTGPGKIVTTEKYGEKYSFPVEVSYHPSYDTLPPLSSNVVDRKKKEAQLDGQTITCEWETKCQSAKQLYYALFDASEPNVVDMTRDDKFALKLEKHYEKDLWRLTRFDTGAYWLEVE
tara:strand:+ start:279 stop:671 length:393 start_codon:yes stop_codon:yes gene_type:complete